MDYYFEKEDLAKFGEGKLRENAEQMWDKFMEYYASVYDESSLTLREKSLIALATAFAVQCPYCIDAYTNACLERGCDQDQIIEVAHVVATIKAGATLAFGVQSKNIIEKKSMK